MTRTIARGVLICSIWTIGIAATAGVKPGGDPSIAKVEKMLQGIPTIDDFDVSGTPGMPTRSELEARLERSMRLLQPVSCGAIRAAIAHLVQFYDDSTPEYRALRKQLAPVLLREDPGADSIVIQTYVMQAALKKVEGVFWVDRFLFLPPDIGLAGENILDMLVQPPGPEAAKPNWRLYPVTIVRGAPHLVASWRSQGLDFPPTPAQYLKEFDDYSSHYKRRPRWW